ncbi:MAG: metalloregulator ArsR/SmtB family transcription factor [Blastomonas sp.]
MSSEVILKALSDPTRLRIAELLRIMELTVGELAQVLGQSQPRVSRHIRILDDAGLVGRRKEGSSVFVGLTDAGQAATLLDAVVIWSSEGERHWATADQARLAAVRADRAAAAEAYFAAHAEEWDAIRSLHIAESMVDEAMLAALDGEPLGQMVDIGTGTGTILQLFASRAERVIGIDRSAEMLKFARAKVVQGNLPNTEVRQGDMYALDLPTASADTVILHQVLHFAQQPAAALAEAARILKPGGRLLLVDVAPHEIEELRTRNAHARLGFSDQQIAEWFAAAGIEGGPHQDLPGGELTIKLWLGLRIADSRLKVVSR